MDNPRLAGRYAKSLIDLAIEQNQLEAVYADIKFLQSITKSNPDLVAMLRSPIIHGDKKIAIIAAITKDKIGILTTAFIKLLAEKGREQYLPEITSGFIDQYNQLKNIHRVKLTTAVTVSDDIKQSIVQKVNAMPGVGSVELETEVKQELIGGFILETDNKLVDASILRDLKDVKKQFKNNEYIHRIR